MLLVILHHQSLLQELGSPIGDIPYMDSFKISDMPKEATMPEDNDGLFHGSRTSVSESALLIMAFAVRHKLPGVALQDLLCLVALHCPKPNKCIDELNHCFEMMPNSQNVIKRFFTKKLYLVFSMAF